MARRGCNRRNSSGSGSAHHIPLHETNLRMAIRSRSPGNEARSDHDFAVSLAIPCVRNMPPRALVLHVTPMDDNRVPACDGTATMALVCRIVLPSVAPH